MPPHAKFWPDDMAQLSVLPGGMVRSLTPKVVRLRDCPEAFQLQAAIEQGDAATFAGDYSLAESHYDRASAITGCLVCWTGGCLPFPASKLCAPQPTNRDVQQCLEVENKTVA